MRIIALCCSLVLIAAPAHASEDKFVPSTSKVERMHGDFYVSGFINLAGGWQKFSDDPVTERAQDGSFPGPLGEFLPNVIWRGSIALAASTGIALSADFSDHFSLIIGPAPRALQPNT